MATTIIEQVAQVIATRLALPDGASPYNYAVAQVIRRDAAGYTPDDKTIVLAHAGATVNDEQSIESGDFILAYDHRFAIIGYLSIDEATGTIFDAYQAQFIADIFTALTSVGSRSWITMGDLATRSRFGDIETFLDEETGLEGFVIELIVTVRTPVNDPYTAT